LLFFSTFFEMVAYRGAKRVAFWPEKLSIRLALKDAASEAGGFYVHAAWLV
jgi:hypothetical protein